MSRGGAPFYRHPGTLSLLAGPWLVVGVFGATDAVRALAARQDPAARRRRAASRARKRLKNAARLAGKGSTDAFYAEVARVVVDYLADKLGENVRGLTREELALCCASHSSEPGQVALVRDFLAKIDCGERDLPRIRELVGRYADLSLGTADASVIACAERNGGRILTFDVRNFGVVARDARITLVL